MCEQCIDNDGITINGEDLTNPSPSKRFVTLLHTAKMANDEMMKRVRTAQQLLRIHPRIRLLRSRGE